MMWHLHYDNFICHKIFKLLIQPDIWFGLRSIQNNIFIQNTRPLYRIFIIARYHLSKNQQIHMHITAQHHLWSHFINNPKTKKTSHSITGQPRQLYELSQKVSPLRFSLASSGSWNFSFKSSNSLCRSSIVSLCCWNLLTGKKGNDYKYRNTTINQISDIYMFVTSSHISAHAKLQYECKYHNTL